MKQIFIFIAMLGLAAPRFTAPSVAAQDADVLRYENAARPIFEANCFVCHGEALQHGGLRLDQKSSAMQGGSSGNAIIPGDVDSSLLIELISNQPPQKIMPPRGKRLAQQQIETLRKWIDQGAKWAETETNVSAESNTDHWAFQKPMRPKMPSVKQGSWPQNPIDHFVLARLEEEGIEPSPEASRETLIRRVSLDLTGIPPSPEDVKLFVEDQREDAFERLADWLLNSPHYGERWGRHWLDAARYADSNGYSIDGPRSIWKYRDWVIDAFNQDMSFDRFTIFQMAGDLIPHATTDTIIATGFHRNTKINQEGGIDKEQFRIESVVDRVNTTGTVFLGITIGCAQCHDHKFDPFKQKEYYQLFDIFNQDDEPSINTPTSEEQEKLNAYQTQMALLKNEMDAYLTSIKRAHPTSAIKELETTDAGYQQRKKTLDALKKTKPDVTTTMTLRRREKPRSTHIHIQGDFTRHGESVTANVPQVLPSIAQQNPNRLHLAEWLVSPENPLTARVVMNRMWQRYFGTGLVATENDFGARGAQPTHPELLDWLATEFMRRDWSMKAMHRLIVTSSTYRQSSKARPALLEIDPYNSLLSRQNRLRLDAEIIRDSALAVSGLLNQDIGGPSVYPPQPEGVTTLGQVQRGWNASKGADRYRRGLYTFFWRATPHPGLMVFDAPDANSACTRRTRSNIPLQALNLLNDETYMECAAFLASRAMHGGELTALEQINLMFRHALARSPKNEETNRLHEYYQEQMRGFENRASDQEQVIQWINDPPSNKQELAALTMTARVIFNLDEFITRE